MRARVYRPSLGRFLSPDPIKLGGGATLFAFVNSGPLTWRDPWGLSSRDAEGAFARVHQQASEYLAERSRSEPPVPMGDWLQRSYQQKWSDLGHTGNLLSLARFGDESAIRELDDEALQYCGYVGDSEPACQGVTSDISQQRATQDAFGIVGASPTMRGGGPRGTRIGRVARPAGVPDPAVDLGAKIRSGETSLDNDVLFRTRARDPKGRLYGGPDNPALPPLSKVNPRIYVIDAGDLRIGNAKHGENPAQTASVERMSNEELVRFRLDDPISSVGLNGGALDLSGGFHRSTEIMKRVQAGTMPANTPVWILLHD